MFIIKLLVVAIIIAAIVKLEKKYEMEAQDNAVKNILGKVL